jgi:hypothetical protein
MKIKLLGINLESGSGFTLANLFNYIGQHNDPVDIGGYGRFLYIDERDGFHVGLLITTKNQKKYLEFKHDKTAAKLEAKDVSEGAKFADFNFFAINKKTGRGIYQYYHHSCSLNMFGVICRSYYERLRQAQISEAMKTCHSTKEEKAIKKHFAGTLKWEIVVRPEAFDALVRSLKSIKAVTLTLSTLAYEKTVFTPISRVAKRMTQRYTFAPKTPISSLVSGIRDVVSKADVDGAKVEGIGQDGLEQVIKLINTPDFFGSFDFDAVASTMTITPKDFVESAFLTEIIKVAKSAPALKA